MKRLWLPVLLTLMLCCATAFADEAGVLTETELGSWLNRLLLSTIHIQPLNAPVGEEALTGDGYAFIYDTVTLYYNKPTLDAQSVLQALAVTDESLDTPRGIRLGAPDAMLLSAYGWKNPTLAGDESFAPLYVLNQLPENAYWAWAQRSGEQLQSVQCAIHARTGEGRYTDTGVLYTLQKGIISSIRVYGLNATVSLAEVENNLSAVGGVPTSATVQPATGVTVKSDAEPFGQEDLQFNRVDFLTLTEKDAGVIFGEPTDENWAQDDHGAWLHTLTYEGASLMFAMDGNRQNAQLESLTVTDGHFDGPRGLTLGAKLDQVIASFRCDGSDAISGTTALLYGDGQTPPFGTLERTGGDAVLRYETTVTGADGTARRISLRMTFADAELAEWMIYSL